MARTREDTLQKLKSQFLNAQKIGGQTDVKKARTATGVKDTYQSYFVDKLFALTAKRGRSREERSADVSNFLANVPHLESYATSPVWRIQGVCEVDSGCLWAPLMTYVIFPDFNPHTDTPVEILHVILLGFVKYLWRDTVSRLKDSSKNLLVARLSSFDVSGLGIPRLAGATLVTYAKSLVGRDFRAVAQAAPFVLHDLPGIPDELHNVWTAMSHLIPLVWQPEIENVSAHKVSLPISPQRRG